MANKEINQYTAAVSIDATADYLLIDPNSTGVYNKINRNVLLGITGSPIGDSDSQTLSNKTIGNTNTITAKDANFTLQDDADTTKQLQFQLSGITTGTTRTLTVPDASLTLVGTATTQTLTNKTLTSPTISGGTIDNATITTDSISGHSSATVVTVANLQISNGVLNTNNSVVTANIADGAVTPAKLVSGTGSGWAWSSWSPTWTNLTVGNSTVTALYIQNGKTVFYRLVISLGSTASVGTGPYFTLPVTASTSGYVGGSADSPIGKAGLATGGNVYDGVVLMRSSTTALVRYQNAAATAVVNTEITASAPGAWTTGDIITLQGFYEAA